MNTSPSVIFILLAICLLVFINQSTATSIEGNQGNRKHLRTSGELEKTSIPFDEGHRALNCYSTGTLCIPKKNSQPWQQKCAYCCEKATIWPSLGGVWACGTCLPANSHCDLVTPCTQACCSTQGHIHWYFWPFLGEYFCN